MGHCAPAQRPPGPQTRSNRDDGVVDGVREGYLALDTIVTGGRVARVLARVNRMWYPRTMKVEASTQKTCTCACPPPILDSAFASEPVTQKQLAVMTHQYPLGRVKVAKDGAVTGEHGKIAISKGAVTSVASGSSVIPGDVAGLALNLGKFVRVEHLTWGNNTYRYERGSVHVNVVVMPPCGGEPTADTGRYLNRAVVVYEHGKSRTIYYYERKRVTHYE
jgi:hypothetical protein